MTKRAFAMAACVLAGACVTFAAEPVRLQFAFQDRAPGEAIAELGRRAGVEIAFPPELLAKARPVTLKAEGITHDDALASILRPRGVAAVWSGDKRMKLLPAATPLGMTKSFGRALRTFERLEGLLRDRARREELGRRARELIERSRGATDRNIAELAKIWSRQ